MERTTDIRARRPVRVAFDAANLWRSGFVLLGVAVVAAAAIYLVSRGSGVLFVILMAWFASLAMDPAVRRLARHMPRAAATALTMLAVALFFAGFLTLFGQLFITQVAQLVQALPTIIEAAVGWLNRTFDQDLRLDDLLDSINLNPEQAAGYAGQIASGVLAVVASVVGGIASFFMFALFTFYLSTDGPRLRFWIASLFPPRMQELTLAVWDTTAEKTGGYVSARVILAAVNSTASGIVFLLIGLPSWLALAIWTGLVAQFVPAIGTYISITLPVLVGILSPNPWLGVVVLGWGILYQQVENLTFEPRISARAVDVHPAVSFASVLLGGSLFGVAGALLAIPVAAMLLTLLDLYRTRYALVPELAAAEQRSSGGSGRAQDGAREPEDTAPEDPAPADRPGHG